jgi:peptidoglycan-associated lipoprotein
MRRLTLLVPVLIAVGCAHQTQTRSEPIAANTPAPVAAAPSTPGLPGGDPSCTRDLDCGDRQLCIRNRCVDITAGLAECSQVRVHFPFNSSEIEAAERTDLDRSARCLKADHALHVSIEGNADERGTEEYNLALGDQRATAVKRYLESLGTSDAQLKTVSYGKENPLCTEHDESCWAKNRRADVKLAAGKARRR